MCGRALIPPTLPRPAPPVPLPMPSLARPSPDAHAQLFLLDMARLDASGRFVCRPLLRALNWAPGQRVDLTALDDAVLFTANPAGRTAVGQRGELAIPSSTRVTAGLEQETQVLLVAPSTTTWKPRSRATRAVAAISAGAVRRCCSCRVRAERSGACDPARSAHSLAVPGPHLRAAVVLPLLEFPRITTSVGESVVIGCQAR